MKNKFFLSILGAIIFSMGSCKKSSNPTPTPTPVDPLPTIAAISPIAGPKNTVVTITGTNFGINLATLKVYFNGVQATVQTATNTAITAVVPVGASTGAVKVEKTPTVQITGPVFTYLVTGLTTTFAGNTFGFADGLGTAALFASPTGITKDIAGNFYVADRNSNRIRKITPDGNVTTFAGSGSGGAIVNGTGTAAGFYSPYGITADPSGNLFVGEYSNQAVRKITPAAVVTTLAGNGTVGNQNGTGTAATFNQPVGLAVDASGNVFIADFINHLIRKITPAGVVTTFAGNGTAALVDGTGTGASFNGPFALAFDAAGNLVVADYLNHAVRKITPSGVVTTIAGNGTAGYIDASGSAARFNRPAGLAIDATGNIFICDAQNNRIRKITATGVVSTLAGNSNAGSLDGVGAAVEFNYPLGLCGDFANSTLYIADFGNNRIRKLIID
jgi:sugar lactone lactonase YvrE